MKVEVNGKPVTLTSGNYHLPVPAGGVQVDCPVTGGYRSNSSEDPWGLVKDARIRLWPAGSPWIEPDDASPTRPASAGSPRARRWRTSRSTSTAARSPSVKKIYYHNGLDIGGAEGLVEVVAATDGVVVSAGTERLAWLRRARPVRPRYDVVYVLDDRGWYYRYSHLQSIDPAIKPGATVRMGQKIGVLGKEGGSGGWSHLHFEITSRQPSGRWGTQEGYAFLWQAYLREQKPEVLAVARPHRLAWTGEPVVARRRRSRGAGPARSRASSGPSATATTASGPRIERTYDRPGSYSEILKVTDQRRHIDYDFAIVQVLDRSNPEPSRPRSTRRIRRQSASSPATRSRSRCGPSGRPTATRPGTSATAPRPSTSNPTATSTSTPGTVTPSRPTASRSPATTSSASSGPTAAAPRRPRGCTSSSRAAAPGDPARAP